MIAGFGGLGTSVREGGDTGGGPLGGVPVAVAAFVTLPASTSAWVTEYIAVQVTFAPGAMDFEASGHVMAGFVPVPEKLVSFTVTSARVTLPVLVTRKS
nr:hypothetical protein [Streptomyces sp. NRRL WC-3742]